MWSSRLFWRAFTALVGLIVTSAVVLGMLVTSWQEHQVRTQLTNRLRVSAILLGQVVRESLENERNEQLQELIRKLGDQTQTRLTVIEMDGHVLADSAQATMQEVAAMDNHKDRPELREAAETGTGASDRYSDTLKAHYIYFAFRVDDKVGPIGLARSALPDEHLQQHYNRIRRLVLLQATIATLLAIGVSYALVARITKPLTKLTHAAERIADGDLRQSIDVVNRNEVGTLAETFNRMSRELAKRIDELRERGDQLATVLGGMSEGVIAVDDRARIMFANESAGRLFDFDAADARGRPLLTVIRDETLRQSVSQAMETGGVVQADIELYGPTTGILSVHASPLPGTPCPGVVLVLNDMTELRRLESLRQDFVANVSHELKTPLSSIKAYAETLREGAIHDDLHNVKFVVQIEDQADRLNQLILDMLSLARIEAGQQTYDVTDVVIRDVVRAVFKDHEKAAEAKQIKLECESPPNPVVVRTDDEALRQILDNLINNAIKYTPVEGQISIRWRADNDSALIEVIDNGIGISEEDQSRLFERFFRVDKARSRELGGTGLGLSIVKHLAQCFGGTVGVRSTPGEGSCFWVRLPASRSTPKNV